mgnify:CR=1 FL=1
MDLLFLGTGSGVPAKHRNVLIVALVRVFVHVQNCFVNADILDIILNTHPSSSSDNVVV